MGPRFFKRGENLNAKRGHDWERLQWGHAFSSVESTQYPVVTDDGIIASMGPRFFKRGEIPRRRPGRIRVKASMGPRFFKRGESTSSTWWSDMSRRFNGATLFQAWRARGTAGL